MYFFFFVFLSRDCFCSSFFLLLYDVLTFIQPHIPRRDVDKTLAELNQNRKDECPLYIVSAKESQSSEIEAIFQSASRCGSVSTIVSFSFFLTFFSHLCLF